MYLFTRHLTVLTVSFCHLVAAMFMTFSVSGAAAAEMASVMDVRFGVNDDGQTRIVLDLSDEIKYRVYTKQLSDQRLALGVEMEKVSFAIGGESASAGTSKGIGHIGTYAYATGDDGRTRFLFDLKESAVPTSVFLIKPKTRDENHRLVIDMTDASEEGFRLSIGQAFGPLKSGIDVASAGDTDAAENAVSSGALISSAIEAAEKASVAEARQEKLLARAPLPRVKPKLTGRWKIVIDAGHGGKDPGAVGQAGTLEKTVNLAAAKQLRDILKSRGYEVFMTREGDTYPEREERIEMARSENADLFLSIHADAARTPDVRGASVYTLSDKGSVRTANQLRNDGNFILYDEEMGQYESDVREIVLDVVLKESRSTSAKFARMLTNRLSEKVTMVNNMNRQANYVVLLSPDVPAVLLELAFISNAADELNLNSKAWRTKAVTAVADSIDEYFDGKKPVKHAMNGAAAQ